MIGAVKGRLRAASLAARQSFGPSSKLLINIDFNTRKDVLALCVPVIHLCIGT